MPVMPYEELHGSMTLMTGDEKHASAATSTLDVLWVLYDRVLRVSPETIREPDRDRFVLSKGHGPMAFYAVLAEKGFIDRAALRTFGEYDSILGHHPDARLIPGVEISSGSLGHGLPMAVGMAIGLRLRRSPARVFCLVGDAELEEGSNHEAIAFAGRSGLANLCTLVVDNRSSSHGWPGGIAARFELEGWSAVTIDGRDHDRIEQAVRRGTGRPHAVIAVVEPRS